MNQQTHTVVIVEDDPVLRAKLANLIELQSDMQLLACEACVENGLEALQAHQPDALLTDLGLPDGSGVELISFGVEQGYDTEAMVVSVFGDERHVVQALQAGASGSLLKDAEPDEIAQGIRQMLKGGSPISPAIARHLLKRFRSQKREMPEKLTRREQEILQAIAKGYSAREIAEMENITYYTVTTHVKNIYRKLAVNSRTEAIFEAINLKLVDPG